MKKYAAIALSLCMGSGLTLSAASQSASSSSNWANDLLFQDSGTGTVKVTPRPLTPRTSSSNHGDPSVSFPELEEKKNPVVKRSFKKRSFKSRASKMRARRKNPLKIKAFTGCKAAKRNSCIKNVTCRKVVRCNNQTKCSKITVCP